jgi:membrane-associated phospholipid phosphatase
MVVERIHELLYPLVSGSSANFLVVQFQKFCGVLPDGTVRYKFVKKYFRVASACGEEIFSLMPVLFWFAYPIAVPFATNFVFLLMVGQICKDVFKLPRPSAVGTGIVKLGDQHFETEYGLPSTHTMTGYLPLSTVLCLARNGISISITAWTFCGALEVR